MASLKIFISSTWKDLGAERAAVESTLHRLRSARFVGMEYFGARSDSTRDVSLSEVDRSDIYVGVFGHRYGSGITEQEYRRARGRNLPCLIYLKNGWQEPVDGTDADAVRLQQLRGELLERHLVGFFDRPDELAAKLTADLHNLLFDRLVVQGISQLRGDYDARIQRFLTEYLGTPEHRIPFGGRDDQLETLDRWVRDPRSAPYAVVAGPAGRGKSALLVHWAQRLMQDAALSVIFLPISIRFRTNLASVAFASMAARLAALHGEIVPGGVDTPPDVWRTLMLSYLRREVPSDRTFVLIVDGADESGDWTFGSDLFPVAPPRGLRVLVSARYLAGDVDARGWLERLGWTSQRLATSFDLPPLTPTGLVDVLRNMSVPLEVLSGRADIVAELFRLSQGDPLLVNLYVADLWTKGEAVGRLKPDDLATLEPGLDGYFRRWWDDQRVLWGAQSPLREPAVNALLDTLSCALGPLLSAELLDLIPPQSGVTLWSLDEALRSLERFVIGDGQSQGYAFSHPRLAYYFHGRLSKAGQAQAQEARFVQWGLACLTELANGARDATTIPTYLLQFLRPHMERAGSEPRALMAFASTSWIAAWDRLDKGSFTGFLNDLAHVRRIAEREADRCAREGRPAAFMADELRCALYASSIASIATDVPLAALAQLIAKGIWSPAQAIAYGARIGHAGRRMRTLLELTALSDDANRPLALAAASAEARALSDDNEGRVTLVEVIRGVVRDTRSSAETARVFAAACQVAQQLPSPHDRWMLDDLRYATSMSDLAHVHAVAALRTIEPGLGPVAGSWCQREAEQRIAALVTGRPLTRFAVETFTLLHEVVHQRGDNAAIDAALQYAVAGLADAARHQSGDTRKIVSLALDCVAHMADDDVGHGLSSLIPLLSGEHAQRAVDQIARIRSVASRVDAVSELCNVTRVGPLPWLGPDLIEFVRERSRNGSWWQLSAIPGLTTLLPPDELRRVIETVADEWSPRLILDCLLLAAQSRPPRWSHEDLTTRALEMIRSRLTPSEQKDALVGMIDWLLPPGAVNSGATWRPAPEARQLAPRVKRLLQLCAPAREIVEVAALRLSNDCLAEYPAETRHPLLDIDAAQLADDERSDAGATGTAPADSDERRYALLDAWSRDSDDQVNEVVTALAKLVPRPELDEALQLLVSVHSSIPGDSLRQIAARVIDVFEPSYATSARLPNVVMLLASPPLFPPTNEALRGLGGLLRLEGRDDGVLAMYRDERLPDLLREQLIIVGLTTRRSRRDGARTHSLLMEAGLLDHPSDELLGIVLREVAELPHYIGRDTDRANALSRIVWHVSPAFYGGWLKAFPWSERGKRFDALTRLESVSQMDPDTFWRHMVEALRGYGLSTDRASWLVEFVDHAPRSIYSDLLDIARSLEGDAARFVAMSALAQALDMPERRGVLLEALELARRVSNASVVGHGLVELAVDLARNDAQVLAAATATAVVLPEKRFRVSAFAALAPLLSADALAAASQAFRTIGDGPARARAMVALASSIVEPRQRARAITELVNAITALPPGNTRHAAMLFVSPLVPVNRRWPLVEEALTGGFGTATGFDRAELLDAARRALPDAPARLLRVALNWLATQAPDSTHTTASLLPYLPRWLALPAISLLAEASDKELAAQLAPHLDDLVFARAEDRAARLSENTKSALFRIKAARERRRELRNSPGAQLSAKTLDRVDRITIVHDDRDRAARVTSCALDRERAMSTRAQLAEEAREIGDMPLRVSTTRYLSALAPERALPLCRDAVGGIGSAAHRAVITAHLALRFDGDARRRMLQDALAAARAEEDQALRALAGAEVGRLAPGLAREALEVLLSCDDEETSARAACSMIRHMSDPDAAHAVEALRRIRSEERRAVALSEVADALGIASARAALGVAASMESAVLRGRALTDLASQLPDDCRATADALLDQITTDFAWLNALSALSKRWPDIVNEARARQACTAVIDAGDEECAAEWCQQIIPVWPASLLADLIDAVRALRDIGLRTDVLCTLVRIREDVPADAILRAAREIDDDFHRSVLLGQFAASREPLDERLAAEAIACARASGHRRRYVDALAAMSATRVIPDVLDALLAEFSRRPAFVSSALVAIASLLTGTQARNVLRALERCRSGLSSADRMDLFLALGPRLDAADRPLAFEQLATLTERSRAQVLPELASCFDDERSIEAALAAARAITSDAFRTEALSASMAVLSEEHQRAVLSLLADTRSERERVRRLVNVMPDIAPALYEVVADYGRGLQDEDCRSALLRALDAMRTPANAERNGDEMDATADTVLGDLLTECAGSPEMILATGEASPGIPPALRLSQLVARLRTRPTLVDRADEILSAFPYLSEIAKADLLGQLPAYIDEEQQVRVLSLLGAPLSAALQRAAFDAVCRFQGLECRRRAWAALLPLLDRDMFPRLQDMWREVLQVGSVQDRPQVLAQLHAYVPLLHHRGGDAALLDSVRAISDAGSVWP